MWESAETTAECVCGGGGGVGGGGVQGKQKTILRTICTYSLLDAKLTSALRPFMQPNAATFQPTAGLD